MSVLVILEHKHRMSWETLAAAQQIGAELGKPVIAAVIGDEPELATKKLAQVYAIPAMTYTADGFTSAYEQLIKKVSPSVVIFPHTYQVRDFAPKLATRFGKVLVSDVVKCRIDGGNLILVRQLFQGKLNADYRFTGADPAFVSIQAGAYRVETLEAGTAPVEVFTPAATEIRNKPQDPFRESSRAVDLTAAEIIVSVGRGIKEKENIPIVEELAAALGAEVAASRPICDNGWLPMERQVGSSGQTVSPKVYIAVGISGAIQHLVGMKGSKTIVAINKDVNAPIFEVADYGVVGDLFEIIPALIDEVKKAKGA